MAFTRALATARQCVAEGRSCPPAVVEVLLVELAQLADVEGEARKLAEALGDRYVEGVNTRPLRTALDL